MSRQLGAIESEIARLGAVLEVLGPHVGQNRESIDAANGAAMDRLEVCARQYIEALAEQAAKVDP